MKIIEQKIDLTLPEKSDLMIGESSIEKDLSSNGSLFYIYDRVINSRNSIGNIVLTYPFFHRLVKAYESPVSKGDGISIPRSYHSIDHIIEGLDSIAKIELKCDCSSIDNILLAWFYHDIIYLVGQNIDNERMSAFYAFNDLVQMGFSAETAGRVFDLILWTNHKQNPPESDFEANLIVDIDLLGISTSPIEAFFAKTNLVKKEYSAFSEEEWINGRIKFWESFLKTKNNKIYRTSIFEELNHIALDNINKELYVLKRERNNLPKEKI